MEKAEQGGRIMHFILPAKEGLSLKGTTCIELKPKG